MKWVYWFINSSNFSAHRGQKIFISVIQFAGCSQDIVRVTTYVLKNKNIVGKKLFIAIE